jgi:hypothetical protein
VTDPVNFAPEEVHAHAHKTGHRWLDLGLALTAMFISSVSLYVAIEHGRTERDLVAASTWPSLRAIFGNSYGKLNSVAIGVSNAGVGPAKIEFFEVFWQGQPVASTLDLLQKCCGLGETADAIKRQLPRGVEFSLVDHQVLRPGEDLPALQIVPSKDAPEITDRLSQGIQSSSVTFRACYCSVLDQCWVSDLMDIHATPVQQCPEPRQRFDPLVRISRAPSSAPPSDGPARSN